MRMDFIKIVALFSFYWPFVEAYQQTEDLSHRILQIESRFKALKDNFFALRSRVENEDYDLDEKKNSLEQMFTNVLLELEENFQSVKDIFKKHYKKRERKILQESLRVTGNTGVSHVQDIGKHQTQTPEDQTIDEIHQNWSESTSLESDETFDYGVVFRATTTTKTTFGEGEETIIFSHVDYDTSESYNPNTGVFIAPRKGTYLLTVQLYVKYGYRIDVGLFVNGDSVALASLAPGNNACYNFESITNLEEGDSVRVKHISSVGYRGLDQVFSSNSFSGVMIR